MKKHFRVIVLGFVSALAIFLAYSNHFNNPFELDDFHTIKNNQSIHELAIKSFFKDARTFSSLPANQVYRPGLTTLNALDYALWSNSPNDVPQPKWFHVSIFISFIFLCFLLFFFYKKIFDLSLPAAGKYNDLFALFAATFFGLHTANAEVINYIIARADSFSALLIIMAFLIFIYGKKIRKTFLFVVPVIMGFFVKESAIVFPALLLLFIFLFEEEGSITVKDIFSKKIKNVFIYTVPPFIISLLLFILYKANKAENFLTGGETTNMFHYFITNFYSITHYIANFILPIQLCVDTDKAIISNPFDWHVLLGFSIILFLVLLSLKFSKKKETKPIAFGILWFFITLVPTSTFIPFAEVNNDHRAFFGYIGLVLAVVGSASYFMFYKIQKNRIILFFTIGIFLLFAHFLGVRHRNTIWSSQELLWKDATEKCPKSGRIWMNYGLSLMQKGDYANALIAFNKAKEQSPNYAYVFINLGIVKNALQLPQEAEIDFRRGLALDNKVPDAYYFYGKFLLDHNRIDEAKICCKEGLNVSSNNNNLLNLNIEIGARSASNTPTSVNALLELIKTNSTWQNWLNLSLAFYNANDYYACIDAAKQALKLNATCDNAYNNICAAHNQLKEFDKAIVAGQKGLRINPKNLLLKGNLKVSFESKK